MTWERHGECNHCGHCCTYIVRDVLVRTREQIQRDPAYYTARGFKPMDVDGERRYVLWAWLSAPCPQYLHERCSIHELKPQTCVDFPRLPQDIVGTPCSYWFTRGEQVAGGDGSPHPTSPSGLLQMEKR